jgi:hypothetical protein
MAALIVCLFGLLLPWLFGENLPLWPWIGGLLFSVTALLYPLALAPVYRWWMRFGAVMGAINTYLILGVVFFLLITPIGLMLRLLRIDPLNLSKPKGESLFRQSRVRTPNHMDKPF